MAPQVAGAMWQHLITPDKMGVFTVRDSRVEAAGRRVQPVAFIGQPVTVSPEVS